MTIEHNVITDPNVHEPKGISIAAADKVYVSDGAGSGAWDDPPIIGSAGAAAGQVLHKTAGGLAWQYPAGAVYAEMDIIGNTNLLNIPYTSATARATWLSTDANYIQMTGVSFPFTASILDHFTFDAANDWLVCTIAGDYKIDFWGSFLCADANTFVSVKYAINNTTPFSTQKLTGQSATSSDVINLSAAGIVENLQVGDTINLQIAAWRSAGANTDVTFEDGGMTVSLLHEV